MSFEDHTNHSKEQKDLDRAIRALEAQRPVLGDETVNIAQASMREKLTRLNAGRQEPQERKLITVLFADVSGFTAMAESMDHEIVNSVINSLWSRVDKAIQDQGGRIDKHIGDAVMALFGTPIAHENDPERAIRAPKIRLKYRSGNGSSGTRCRLNGHRLKIFNCESASTPVLPCLAQWARSVNTPRLAIPSTLPTGWNRPRLPGES
jgi:class 3 adenylate cyclase